MSQRKRVGESESERPLCITFVIVNHQLFLQKANNQTLFFAISDARPFCKKKTVPALSAKLSFISETYTGLKKYSERSAKQKFIRLNRAARFVFSSISRLGLIWFDESHEMGKQDNRKIRI